MITFDRQAGPLQNFNRSHVMVIGRSVSFSEPRATPGWGRGAPQTPQNPPPLRNFFFFAAPPPNYYVFAKKKISVTKNFHPAPPPTPTPPPSPQNTHLNPCAIISTPNNSCVRYGRQPLTHLINRHCQQCLYTWSSLSINVHTMSNPQHNDISCIMTRSPSPHKMSRVF